MPIDPRQTIYYKQSRFATRLPKHYWYSPAHYWIAPPMVADADATGALAGAAQSLVMRVGVTKFAARMLGDFVEVRFEIGPGQEVAPGQPIGSLEGFKAIADVYGIGRGQWLGGNAALNQQPELVDQDPYDRGWLYQWSGEKDESWLDVQGYIQLLEATISKMLQAEQQQSAGSDP